MPQVATEVVAQPIVSDRVLVSTASPLATSIALFVADVIAVLLARGLALVFWSWVHPAIGLEQDFAIWLSVAFLPMVYAGLGLYAAGNLGPVEELRRITLGTVLVSLIMTATNFFVRDINGYSRGLFISSLVLIAILVPLNRAFFRYLYAGKPWWGIPVLVLGAGKTATLVIESLRRQPGLGLKPVVCLDDDESKHGDCAGVAVAGCLDRAPELARELKIRHALVAMAGVEREKLVHVIEHWGATFSHLTVIPNLFGIATLWVTTRDLGGILGLQVRQNLLSPMNQWLKRVMDVVMGTLIGVIALPIVGLAALWIKLVSRGPAFYYQDREGENGETIRIRKLRTMYPNSEELLKQHLLRDGAAREEWQHFFKLRSDPRVIPGIGRILRRTSLDELPQIWMVITGKMSLVGPRPFPSYHLQGFDTDFREFRRKVPPGLTGLWQVSARSDGDLKVQELLDVYYIRNWSLWLDIHILARTVGAVVMLKGAY